MTVQEAFSQIYRRDAEHSFFVPYRICPLGAHSDHQLGLIMGIAIDKGIHVAYSADDTGAVSLSSLQFSGKVSWNIAKVPEHKAGDWADYMRGATLALAEKHTITVGIKAVFGGELPIGGLSSSAAVTLAFLSCLAEVNKIRLGDSELIYLALQAEKEYVGVSVGKMDQSCEVYCKKDHLLFLDNRDDSHENIPIPGNMKPFEIAVFFSGLEHSLVGSAFNMRVDECRAAGYALLAYAGIPYGKFGETCLRNIPREVFDAYENRLPENWAKRARHYYTEYERVLKGADAWRNGDVEAFGQLSFESGYSSIYNWETGSPELKALYEILRSTKGVYGGRFSGAGFKGCSIALIDPNEKEQILSTVRKAYLKAFPQMSEKFSACICRSVDGIGGN